MRYTIEDFAKGKFNYKNPQIHLSCERISLRVPEGGIGKGTFEIFTDTKEPISGRIYSDTTYINVNEKFSGESCEIGYSFDATKLEEGTSFEGKLAIICDCGEVQLAYNVTVTKMAVEENGLNIGDDFQLTNLAIDNFNTAAKVFMSQGFDAIMKRNDNRLLYELLRNSGNNLQALEEYLRSIKKKMPASYSLLRTKGECDVKNEAFFVLKKRGYGYDSIHISTQSPYIVLDKTVIEPDDFSDNMCNVVYRFVNTEKIHAKYKAAIEVDIHGASGTKLIYQVSVTGGTFQKIAAAGASVRDKRKDKHERELIEAELLFNRFTAGTVSPKQYEELSRKLCIKPETPYMLLFAAHVSSVSGSSAKSLEYLIKLKNDFPEYENDPVLDSMALYIYSLMCSDAELIHDTVTHMDMIMEKKPDCWQTALCLLLMKKDITASDRHEFAKEQLKYHGNLTAGMIQEALAFNLNPQLFSKLGQSELLLMHYICRHELATGILAERFAYLAKNIIENDEGNDFLLRVLIEWYARFETRELLFDISSLIVKRKTYIHGAFKFIQKSVEEKQKINGIYESYLECFNKEMVQDIPMDSDVMLYFEYNDKPGDELCSILYANLLNYCADSGVLQKYIQKMTEYAKNYAKEGKIDRNYACIYNTLLKAEDPEIANVCFYREIFCSDPEMKKAYVLEKDLKNEKGYDLENGRAYPEILEDEYEVVFEDSNGLRYRNGIKYSINRIMFMEDKLPDIFKLNSNDYRFIVHFLKQAEFYKKSDEEIEALMESAVKLDCFSDECRNEYLVKIITHYYDDFDAALLDYYLEMVDMKYIRADERTRLINLMISRDMQTNAYTAIKHYGYEGVEAKWLRKLSQRRITEIENANGIPGFDSQLVAILHYVFKHGHCLKEALNYLGMYFEGSLSDMYDVWDACREAGVDALTIERKILVQLLNTDGYIQKMPDVFNHYYKYGKERDIIKAFVSYYCYKFLINERRTCSDIFEVCSQEEYYIDNDACLLALVKYYSRKTSLNAHENTTAKRAVAICEKKELYIHYIRKLSKWVDVPCFINNRYYVEYITDPEAVVYINYYDESRRTYVKQKMRDICCGIFVKDFVIFEDDEFTYYITEEIKEGSADAGQSESDGKHYAEKRVTESIKVNFVPALIFGEESDYTRLNLIMSAQILQDEKSVLAGLNEYALLSYEAEQLFDFI